MEVESVGAPCMPAREVLADRLRRHGLEILVLLGTVLAAGLLLPRALGLITPLEVWVSTALLLSAGTVSVASLSRLRRRERHFKGLVAHAADAIMVMDRQGVVRYVSPAFQRTLGLPPDLYVSRWIGTFIHEDDLERVKEQIEFLVASPKGNLRTPFRIRDSKGTWRHLESLSPIGPTTPTSAASSQPFTTSPSCSKFTSGSAAPSRKPQSAWR